MGDKTQVFPLESIESIRTRLTHSYEVANLARSLGIEIAVSIGQNLPADAIRTLPAKSSSNLNNAFPLQRRQVS
jgi:dGTPase